MVLVFFAAWLFGQAMRRYRDSDELNTDNQAAVPKLMWAYVRWVPCLPTFFVSLYWMYVFYVIYRKGYVIGPALQVAVASCVFNTMWLSWRCFRIWKSYRWPKSKTEDPEKLKEMEERKDFHGEN